MLVKGATGDSTVREWWARHIFWWRYANKRLTSTFETFYAEWNPQESLIHVEVSGSLKWCIKNYGMKVIALCMWHQCIWVFNPMLAFSCFVFMFWFVTLYTKIDILQQLVTQTQINIQWLNAIRPYWWLINTCSGNGLVPSGNKPSPVSMLTQIYVPI